MTGSVWLDWAVIATSLFNTILLLWLGLAFFGDLSVLGATLALRPAPSAMLAMLLINPLQAFKLGAIFSLHATLDTLGATGQYAAYRFGEGLPWSFLHQMGTEFLTQLGVPKSQIASTSGFHLAVTFKFLWSPLVDLFGRKRTWLWVMQVLLGLGMIVVGIVAPRGNLTVFWSVMAGVALMHAIHDIACDGFYLQALDRKGQALYSGTRMAAYRAAMWVGKSALVVWWKCGVGSV